MSKKNSQFGLLIDELDTMSKALDADDGVSEDDDLENQEDDKKILDAADDGGTAEGDDPTLQEDDDEMLGKSLSVTLEDGTELEAIDGTELVKSLIAKMETSESDISKALGLTIGNIQKVADRINDQAKVIVEQGKLIKSLTETVGRIGDKPAGRKTVLDVHEKKSGDELHKAEGIGDDGLTGREFMSKALTCQKEGKVTGLEISKAEACLNSGAAVPEDIVRKVVG